MKRSISIALSGALAIGSVALAQNSAPEIKFDSVPNALQLPTGTIQAERRNGAHDKARITLGELTALFEATLDGPKFAGQQEDIRLGQNLTQRVTRGRTVHVEHYALLVQVVAPEEKTLLGIGARGGKGADRTRRRAAGRFELHNIRA